MIAAAGGVPPLCKGRCLWRKPQTEGLSVVRYAVFDGYNPPVSLSADSPLYTRGPLSMLVFMLTPHPSASQTPSSQGEGFSVKRDFSLRQGKSGANTGCICEHFDAVSAEKILYLCLHHIAVAPQGSTKPLEVTGRPISSADRWPPIFSGNSVPSTYCITEGDKPVV